MKEVREQYKSMVLQAARIATKGGIMSQAMEDFTIDNVDRIIDGLSDADFEFLVLNGKVRVRDIETDDQFSHMLAWKIEGEKTLEAGGLTAADQGQLKEMCNKLQELTDTYESNEWDL